MSPKLHPPLPHEISIFSGDEMYDAEGKGGKFMPFHRAGYDTKTGQSPNMPREQKNTMTSWVDGSFVYSTKVPCLMDSVTDLDVNHCLRNRG